MRGGRHGSKRADDDENDKAEADLDQGVALELAECSDRVPATGEPWQQMKTIDDGDGRHCGEQRDLRQQQTAVSCADEAGNAADQEDAVDNSGGEQRANADQPEPRKPRGRLRGKSKRRRVGPIGEGEQQDQRRQSADPGSRRNEMQSIGADLQTGHVSRTAAMPGPRQASHHAGGEQNTRQSLPVRAPAAPGVEAKQANCQHRREAQADDPVVSEASFGQQCPRDVFGNQCRPRVAAEVEAEQREPCRARRKAHGKTAPADDEEAAAKRRDRSVRPSSQYRLPDQAHEQEQTGEHRGRREMNRACRDQGIAQELLHGLSIRRAERRLTVRPPGS